MPMGTMLMYQVCDPSCSRHLYSEKTRPLRAVNVQIGVSLMLWG